MIQSCASLTGWQNSQGLKVFLTEKYGGEFDHAKKSLPPPREFTANEKKVGLFARMKSKVTTSVPKDMATPGCQEYVSDLEISLTDPASMTTLKTKPRSSQNYCLQPNAT